MRKRASSWALLLAAACGGVLLPGQPDAADLTVVQISTPEASGSYVSISGDIELGDWSKFFRLVRRTPHVSGILLHSAGGSADDGLAIAKYANEHGLDTMARELCHSICVVIFLAGDDRYLTAGTDLSMHSAYKQLGDWVVADHKANGTVAWFLGSMGYPLEIARLWLTTPSHEAAPLTLEMNDRLDLGFTIVK